MREIKFRARNESGEILTQAYNGQCFMWASSQYQHNIIIEQYTGLKDINGTEIYEGDIVHWGHVKGAEECVPRKAVVEIAPDIQFKTFNLGKNNHTFKFGRFIYANTSKALEIIGNIHENPDLLEQ